MPIGAVFCSNCGTQIGDSSFSSDPGDPEKPLTDSNNPGSGHFHTVSSAETINPTSLATSLDSPSPRPPVRPGDGPFQTGQQVGPRYTILKLLGTGGMGAVYQAFDHELGVAVAIKVIRPAAQSDATAAKELEQRFKRELVLARQVTHKYVVRIHDLGEIDGIKYLTMPFIEGETLAQLLRRAGTLPLPRAIQIATQIAQGLCAAHEKGVVHRDLKPENIMIEEPAAMTPPGGGAVAESRAGDALIMDFGIARSVQAGATQTAAGSVIGTLEYMAPEQAQGSHVDQRADQYAFGLIFYDMLVGRQRLSRSENPMTELLARLQSTPAPPRTINPAIPEPVNDIVMRCLQPTPQARFESTAALVQALEQLTPDGHLRTGVHEVIQAPPRPRWQLAAAGLLIAALAGTVGWLAYNRNVAPPAVVEREPISVLIADFTNSTGDPVFDGVVEQALGLGIEGASFISTYSRQAALRAAAVINKSTKLDEGTALLVARREGVGLILAGGIEARGSSYHITTRAIRAGTNDASVLYTLESEARGKAQVLETVGSLAGQVRTQLGDTAVPKDGPATNETFTAANLEAARAYVQAQTLQSAGKGEEAIAQYKEAIKLDPDLGRAYAGLGAALANLGRRQEAEEYYNQAIQRIDRMTPREKYRTRSGYFLLVRKADQAREQLEEMVKQFPADSVALSNLAVAHGQHRDMERALEVGRKASAIYPMNVLRKNNVAMFAMYSSKFEEAEKQAAAVLEMNKEYPKAFVAMGISQLALGRPADATATFTRAAALSGAARDFAMAGLADQAMYEGRLTDAAGILEKAIAAPGAPIAVPRYRVMLAEVRARQGRVADAVKMTDDILKATPDLPVHLAVRFFAGRVAIESGKQADALIASLGKALDSESRLHGKLLEGETLLARGDARQALDRFREAQQLSDSWLGRFGLGRAYLELGEFVEAQGEFERCLKRQGEATNLLLDDIATFRFVATLHYYLGRAQEGVKSPAARASFETFLKIKEKGDEAGGLVADARKRLNQ